ncbi:MAG: sugar ABC transporter substrate-binding protein, partial [Armatimonadetes bacterium]|nr:sugar ABC transporter substrate-binding protein [Armatimonadota bacterium]
MTTWRRCSIALILAVAIALTTGCRVAAGPQVTLEFWTISLQPFFTDYINGLIAAYERANPEVKITWVDVQ